MSLEDARPAEDIDTPALRKEMIEEETLTWRQIAVLIAVMLILLMLGFAVLRYWMIKSYG